MFVQLVPLKDSEAADLVPPGLDIPLTANAAVCKPQPASSCLAVFNPVGLEVQLVPFHFSVALDTGAPPKANAAV